MKFYLTLVPFHKTRTQAEARTLEELREAWLPHRDHGEIVVSCYDSTGYQCFRLAEGAAIEFMNSIMVR